MGYLGAGKSLLVLERRRDSEPRDTEPVVSASQSRKE